MRLSPLDIKKQEFSRTIRRGYDPDEVLAFLDMLAGQWEDLLAEQRRTEDKVRELKAKMEHYEKVEEALQEALRTARESSQQTLENAKSEAALIVKKAASEAEDLNRGAINQRDGLQQEIDALLGRRAEIVARLRAFLRAETDLLEHFDGRHAGPAARAPRQAEYDEAPPVYKDDAAHPEQAEPTPGTALAGDGPAADAPTEAPPESQEGEEVPEEVVDQEQDSEEIDVETVDEKEPKKKTRTRNKAKKAEQEEELSPSFFMEDVPSHFADEEEPLSFKFFEINDEENDAPSFLHESEEKTQFAPIPEDTTRKNGHRPRSEDRAPLDSTWIVRPVVSSQTKTAGKAPDDGSTAASEEIDKIRRILSDLG